MKNVNRYKRQYHMPNSCSYDWVKKEYVDKAPIWCSVDLRDGNQALTIPMSLEEKLNFFNTLIELGFKEIEVGFPAASNTEFEFLRTIIDRRLIPKDVKIQVLTQARRHIIEKTFEALEGVDNAIIHLYNSTSVAQRRVVFNKSKEEIKELAISGANMVKELSCMHKGNITLEYSPESFTGTEPEYALDVCNAVIDAWKDSKNKIIINLPATVELSLPHVYASQIEYMSKNLINRDNVILSVHTHNDRGCAIADTELALLAGADRVEGTLFGNGERTGNVDLITVAMNLYMHGVDPKLNLENMPSIVSDYEENTGMSVYERSPYSGKLVFAAFSGSHQDAIAKGIKAFKDDDTSYWDVPYLTIDPKDINREYESDVIRINSQSGKGGVGYILERHYGLRLPATLREMLGYIVKDYSDENHKEVKKEEIFNLFTQNFENIRSPYNIIDVDFSNKNGIEAIVTTEYNNERKITRAFGNGRLDAVNKALKKCYNLKYTLETYEEHALEKSASSRAIAYVGIKDNDGAVYFGAGLDQDILSASIDGLLTAINNMVENKK